MRGKIIITLFILASSMIGCQKNLDNNTSLEFDMLDVKFGVIPDGRAWDEGDEIGIYGFCTRNGAQSVGMSANGNARYRTRLADNAVYFVNASDDDEITALAGDHNFKFYAYYPYSASNTDMTALQVEAPAIQQYALGIENYGLYVANKKVTTVVPTVDLDFKGVFSTVEFYLPDDIVDEDGNTVVRSLVLRPTVAGNFDGTLADGGMYDLQTGIFTSSPSMRSSEVKLDFGATGLTLTDLFTKVSLVVAPFTVPAGGFEVVITDINGFETIVDILSAETDEGTVIAAGEVYTNYLSRENDGIIPVTFPVVFPLGIVGGVQSNNATTQPRWVGEGIWTSSQSQAHAQWYQYSDPEPDVSTRNQSHAFVNSGAISTPEIRGVWTGDYLEFILPVRRFAAGTALTMKFPLYTRQGPIFWNIEYFDEGEWKSNKSSLTTDFPVNNATHEATFFLRYDDIGRVIEHTMVFAEAIQSGHVKIRLTCADGSKQADGTSAATRTATVRSAPWYSGASYAAPFYFRSVAGDQDTYSVAFSIN